MSENGGREGVIHHIRENLFITATGVAAFVHTTWAAGTLFSGNQPAVTANMLTDTGTWLASSWALIAWMIPPMLIAFALDVGQIVTSYRIRQEHLRGRKPFRRYVTFAVFAVATYYLQWAYIAHHLPALELAAGVRADWKHVAGIFRDMALWVVPLLLPLSTMLYTVSDMDGDESVRVKSTHSSEVRITKINMPPAVTNPVYNAMATLPVQSQAVLPVSTPKAVNVSGEHTGEATGHIYEVDGGLFGYTCPKCGAKAVKATMNGAQSSLNVHMGRYCKQRDVVAVDQRVDSVV